MKHTFLDTVPIRDKACEWTRIPFLNRFYLDQALTSHPAPSPSPSNPNSSIVHSLEQLMAVQLELQTEQSEKRRIEVTLVVFPANTEPLNRARKPASTKQ